MSGKTVDAWLAQAAGLLAGAGLEEPRFEARLLLGPLSRQAQPVRRRGVRKPGRVPAEVA